ncbi:MAG TPA: hypothetical protein VMM60_07690 [Ilumatobacter sp.]|nr:hypothetical protein [Ilumatobacter sp.]
MSLITEFESVIDQRVSAQAFRSDLVRAADASSDITVRVAALTYRASAHLNELRLAAACELLDEGLELSDFGNLLRSDMLAWWLLHTAASAHDDARRPQRAVDLVDRAAQYAWTHGLDSQWAQTRTNHVYMLRAAGRSAEVVDLVRRIVDTPLTGHAAIVVAGAVADLYEWAGVPHLAIESWPLIPERTVNSQHLRQAYAHLTVGDLDAALEQVDLDELERSRNGITRQDVATLSTVIRSQITAARGDPHSALDAVLDRRAILAQTDAVTLWLLTTCVAAGMLQHLGDNERALQLLSNPPPDINYGERAMIGAIRADANAELGNYEAAYWCRRDQEFASRHGQLSAVEQAELRSVLVGSRYGRLDDAVEARQRELRAALDERSHLTSLVAKDLRGPIFSIALATELLATHPSDEILALLQAATGALELEVLALTDLDQFESDVDTLEPEMLNIDNIVDQAQRLAAPVLQGRSIDVQHDDGLLTVAGRGELVSRIVAYIVSDIVAHMPPGSDVRLETSRRGERASLVFSSRAVGDVSPSNAQTHTHMTGNTARERFVVRRLVARLAGTFDDVSASDSLRRIVLMLPVGDQPITPTTPAP